MSNVSQERRSITFDCVKCGKVLQLRETVYKKAYEGHDTCLSCRPKESNVSQEQLREEELSKHIDLVRSALYIADANYHLSHIVDELRRLQAIEASIPNLAQTVNNLMETIKAIEAERDELLEITKIPCDVCNGSGFNRPGTGYDSVCSCTGGYIGRMERGDLEQLLAERDRYKAMLQEIRRITPYGMYQELIDKVLKGADTQ